MEETAKKDDDKPVEQSTQPKKHKSKAKAVIVLLVLLLVGGGAYGAYLVKDKNDQLKSKDAKIALLESAPAIESEYNNADEASDETTSSSCEGGSSYTAEIGKFELALDSPRVIIRDLDAGFEGGPITQLEIASCLEGEQLVVDTPPQNEVKILAHPSSSSADLKASYEAQNGTLTADGSVAVGAVSADRFTLSGLFETTMLFFDHNGIGYQIELSDTNAVTSAILNDITNDWLFTP